MGCLPEKSATKGLTGRLVFAILAGCLGSAFQHGYNTGLINTPEKLLSKWINETTVESTGEPLTDSKIAGIWSIVTAIFAGGGMLGGMLVGLVADKCGRKGGLLLINALVLIAVLLEGLAKTASSYTMLIFGRFIIGVNAGMNAGLAPMYLSEIAPMHLRGAIGTVYQLIITISISLSQILSLESLLTTTNLWPVLFILTIIPAIFQCITLPMCPESPKYLLINKECDADAKKALEWLRHTNGTHDEMEEMRQESEQLKLVPHVSMMEIIRNPALRIPMIIAIVVMLAQQFSGINAIMTYSTSIFIRAGMDSESAGMATIGVGVVNVIMTIVSLVLVERCGRKTLLLFGFVGMVIDTILFTICFLKSKDSTVAANLCVVLMIVYIILFASGPGSIPWFLVSELFNQSARPVATSIAIAVNWAANFVVVLGYKPLEVMLEEYVFVIFIVCQLLSALFIYYKVPETKNKTIEEISSMFRQQTYH